MIYTSTPGQWDPPTGDYLEELTNEIDPKDGNSFTNFCTGGPKNYAYTLNSGKTVCKVRGITLNYRNSKKVNFNNLHMMVQSISDKQVPPVVIVTDSPKISRDVKRRKVINSKFKKDYRTVYEKELSLTTYELFPFVTDDF
ncbi:hypothetical protein HOLleu_18344 [Holothuria leucospilota]|uniref:Uncharacterized protein n=1 Tax=Holothuria leucospilota TaxID=206669 RepID=A0A9Q1H917_HOLLE|nr:hypothetical protein HOLleu_18344 [Holothuria leucospilota]